MKKAESDPVPLSNALMVEVVVYSDQWLKHHFDCEEYAENISQAVLRNLNLPALDAQLELTVMLADDQKLHELNSQYREVDKPTNVLSFPYAEIKKDDIEGSIPQHDSTYLGDIALSYETIAREAIEQNKLFKSHFTHMLVHGILHIFGYDHEDDIDAQEMEELESRILLEEFNIPNPYIIKV